MEKKILIPTNFSKHSWNSLVFALNLYKKFPCTFYLINVYDAPGFLSDSIPLNRKEEEEHSEKVNSEHGLDRIMKGLNFRQENPNHRFETISYQGNLVEGIQENVDKLGIDLIIMGAPGDSAGINTAYDNKISKITEEIEKCPVLVIPEAYEPKEGPGREIVLPSNFRIPFREKELEPLTELSRNMNPAVRVLYINSDNKPLSHEQEEHKSELAKLLEKVECSFHTLTQTTATTGVHLFLQSRESEMLALYQRKQGFFSRLFSKAALEELDFDPKVPVLILKEDKQS